MKKIYAILLIIFIICLAGILNSVMQYQGHSFIGLMLLAIGVYLSKFIWNQTKTLSDKNSNFTTNKSKPHKKNETIICKNCKRENNPNNKFCIYCGTKIETLQEKSEKTFNKIKDTKIYKEIMKNYDGILVALLAKISKVDGKITQDEAQYISKIYDELCQIRKDIPNIRNIYKEILKNEKTNLDNLKLLCSYLTKNSDESSNIHLLRILIELAYIDGNYSKEEENLIVRIVYILNIDFSIYKQIIAEYQEDNTSNNSSNANNNYLTIDECYKLLNSNRNNTNQEIKKNYRILVRQYHTDVLSSKELPIDMIAFAEEKLKKINMAYEKIKKYRGIK